MTGAATAGPVGVSLAELLRAVDPAYVEVLVPPAAEARPIATVMLVDADDLVESGAGLGRGADVCLLAGVPEPNARAWLLALASGPPGPRPVAVLSKAAAGSAAMQEAARAGGVGLVAVHAQARAESMLASLRGLLDHSFAQLKAAPRGHDAGDAGTDLFGLARTVASLTNGMVSIEDERSLVLAYSASDDAADEVRRRSILGREGPADYLRRLREWGVFERLRHSDDVIEVPADPELGLQRRLVVSITGLLDPSATDAKRPPTLGAIWVQEGRQPLAADAEGALRGAAAVAARLITRALNAPNNEAIQIQRLLGARGGGVDVPSLAAALSISTNGPAVVIGFAALDGAGSGPTPGVAAALRLHASAFARESLVTAIGERSYVLLPRTQSLAGVSAWTAQVVERVAAHSGVALRAAVAAPVGQLADVAAARAEVDRVLDATTGDRRVTTLAGSRTPVLLGEIADLIGSRDDLRDPRIAALLDYDDRHASAMRRSVEAYLSHFGDVRSAAQQLQIHPNTLRYRIGRAEKILDIDLTDPAGRLLVELQLLVLRRQGQGRTGQGRTGQGRTGQVVATQVSN